MAVARHLRWVTALLAVALVSPASALGARIGGFSVRPATYDSSDPATRAYFKQDVAPGGSFHGQVVVSNTRGVPIDLRVYSVDGLTGVTSGAVYGNRGDRLRGPGRWLAPAASIIEIPPGRSRLVSFTLRVPRNATPGEHLAGIAFEDARRQTSRGKFAITEVFRAVVGVEVRVGRGSGARIHLGAMALQPLPGTRIASLVIDLGDQGQLLCKPRLAASLSGAGSASRQLDTILPGDTIPYPFAWPRALAAGDYAVSVRATRCGPATTAHAVVHLGQPLSGQAASQPPAKADRSMPWWLLALVGVGGVLLGAALARRRRPAAPAQPAPSSPEPADPTTLPPHPVEPAPAAHEQPARSSPELTDPITLPRDLTDPTRAADEQPPPP